MHTRVCGENEDFDDDGSNRCFNEFNVYPMLTSALENAIGIWNNGIQHHTLQDDFLH